MFNSLLIFVSVLIFRFSLSAQSGILYDTPDAFGPCNTYLNILEYKHSFIDLRKDTLRYEADNDRFAAIFIQHKTRLLAAELFDKNGRKVSSGNLTNGTGQLIVTIGPGAKSTYNFKNGKLNDSAIHIRKGKLFGYTIYKDNIPVKKMTTFLSTKTITNYDSLGTPHDSTLYYGYIKHLPTPYRSVYPDLYKGKIRQVSIYEHGHLKELIIYKKSGAIKTHEIYKIIPKDLSKKYPKNCL